MIGPIDHNQVPLRVENLSFGYGSTPLFSSLSFELAPKSITCLAGGNGVGKTTLFNLITGYLKIKTGKIIIQGRDLTHSAPHQISLAGVSRTFQDLRLIPSMSVKDHLRLSFHRQPSETLGRALLPQGFFRREQKRQDSAAMGLLESYNLREVANQRADSISFGQQKLLTLACCEASGGSIFLLDEPAAGIHPQYKEEIIRRLNELARGGRTILLIEHQTDLLQKLGNQFFLLREHSITRYGHYQGLAMALAEKQRLANGR